MRRASGLWCAISSDETRPGEALDVVRVQRKPPTLSPYRAWALSEATAPVSSSIGCPSAPAFRKWTFTTPPTATAGEAGCDSAHRDGAGGLPPSTLNAGAGESSQLLTSLSSFLTSVLSSSAAANASGKTRTSKVGLMQS